MQWGQNGSSDPPSLSLLPSRAFAFAWHTGAWYICRMRLPSLPGGCRWLLGAWCWASGLCWACPGRLLVPPWGRRSLLPLTGAPLTPAVREVLGGVFFPTGVPLGESIGHTARFARIANVKAVPLSNPWK